MSRRPVIIDCDPGQDDAVMLMLAFSSPELDIKGITAVAGNVPLSRTQRNARLVCELGGRTDIPVFAGCVRPMVRDLLTAEDVHGEQGISIEIREPEMPLQEKHAVDFLVESLLEQEMTLVVTGPLTNLAMALVKEPRIASHIKEIVLMGGSRAGGNVTPSAEFNILVDPHAAHVVFESGRPIVVMPLDVTHQALTTSARLARVKAIDTRVARAVHSILDYHDSTDGGPLHDPCTIAYLVAPQLFTTKHVHVAIELKSDAAMGATLVDFWGVTGKPPNAHWAFQIDADGFYDLLIDRIATL